MVAFCTFCHTPTINEDSHALPNSVSSIPTPTGWATIRPARRSSMAMCCCTVGDLFASRIIRWATGSPYSHAGLAVWWNERLMVLEAVGKGVVVTPLSANVRGYHGDVEWFTSVDDDRR